MEIFTILQSLIISFFSFNNWKMPAKKRIIIYDKARTQIIEKYLRKEDYIILDVRYKNNNSLNFLIIFKLFLKLNLTPKTYKNEFIKAVSPKFIISMIDNNVGFYRMKQEFPKIKFILIQFAWRQNIKTRIISKNEINTKSKIKNVIDFFIVFNESLKKEFQQVIKSKYLVFGSFTSNSFKINNKSLRYKYVIIGQNTSLDFNKKMPEGRTVGEFYKPDLDFYKALCDYIIKNRNEKVYILGKSLFNEGAMDFYDNLLGKGNYHYINRSGYSYDVLNKSKFIFGTTSTLLYEALSRGKRVGIFSHKSKIKYFKNTAFGWPTKFKKRGPFWTDSIQDKEIDRIVNYLENTPEKIWKKTIKIKFDKVLKYDQNNSKFLKFAKKIKMPVR